MAKYKMASNMAPKQCLCISKVNKLYILLKKIRITIEAIGVKCVFSSLFSGPSPHRLPRGCTLGDVDIPHERSTVPPQSAGSSQ